MSVNILKSIFGLTCHVLPMIRSIPFNVPINGTAIHILFLAEFIADNKAFPICFSCKIIITIFKL